MILFDFFCLLEFLDSNKFNLVNGSISVSKTCTKRKSVNVEESFCYNQNGSYSAFSRTYDNSIRMMSIEKPRIFHYKYVCINC
ncbi:hypothetical protein SAMN04489864_102433 [Pedobacter insulae]|uniref:Uncharacterized protein n=1 Tax=Pedobacter insulae TaxID=414048 RepID=A0A1I2V2Y7_9SPHI|nr:hypothetical protein SAMN04489864_102433 [Pedobacter insulae]